jgi:hypothetical protein
MQGVSLARGEGKGEGVQQVQGREEAYRLSCVFFGQTWCLSKM